MIILASVTDKLRLVTSSVAPVHVHASFADFNGTVVTTGRTNTAIAAAATTDIVLSPAAATQRNVKTLHVRTTSPSSPVDVTVQHTDGAVVANLEKVILAPNEELSYVEGVGFRHLLADGSVKTQDADAFETLYNAMAGSTL